jgi:hypothetical protein
LHHPVRHFARVHPQCRLTTATSQSKPDISSALSFLIVVTVFVLVLVLVLPQVTAVIMMLIVIIVIMTPCAHLRGSGLRPLLGTDGRTGSATDGTANNGTVAASHFGANRSTRAPSNCATQHGSPIDGRCLRTHSQQSQPQQNRFFHCTSPIQLSRYRSKQIIILLQFYDYFAYKFIITMYMMQ